MPASLVDLAIAPALTSKASFSTLPLAGWLPRTGALLGTSARTSSSKLLFLGNVGGLPYIRQPLGEIEAVGFRS